MIKIIDEVKISSWKDLEILQTLCERIEEESSVII
jgi:hypothetical protein